jgi:glycosyltransferase involved in cell wall biosynthesis
LSDYNNIPLFSVVIPTYNRADFIGIAIKSVVNQSFRNWELIVVDDGSTDNTREVVYSFKDDRIKYHFQENQELNAARNKGIMLAKGDFITFLDDDDYYLSDYLSQSKTLIDDNGFKTGIYRSGVIIHSEGKEIKGPKYSSDLHKNPTNFFLGNTAIY